MKRIVKHSTVHWAPVLTDLKSGGALPGFFHPASIETGLGIQAGVGLADVKREMTQCFTEIKKSAGWHETSINFIWRALSRLNIVRP